MFLGQQGHEGYILHYVFFPFIAGGRGGPLPAHDAGALPSIVSAASPAIHSRALSFMLLPPLLPFPLAE